MDILPSQNAGIKGVFFDAMTLMKKMVAASVHPTKVKNLRFWSLPSTMKTMIYTRFDAPFFAINLVTLNLDFHEKNILKKDEKPLPSKGLGLLLLLRPHPSSDLPMAL